MRRFVRWGDEGGFSVFEVVIAAAILFFAITAILGLVATTTDMGINARRRNLVTNVIASRMEHYRALPFDKIALYPSGSILANETLTFDRYTVVLNTQVRDLGDGSKEIRITATVTTDERGPYTTSASTYVRDRDIDFTALAGGGKPNVRFGDSSPAEGSVVFDDYVEGGGAGSLRFHAIAESPDPADPIQQLSLSCGGPLRDSPFGTANRALWDYTGADAHQEEYFTWHTRSIDPTIPDGWQTVTLSATNVKGTSSDTREYLVDNFAPATPTSLIATSPSTNVQTPLKWNRCQDGAAGNYAAWYDVGVWELLTSSTSLPATSVVYSNIVAVTKDVPTLGFTRYLATVRSYSTRGLTDGVCTISPRPFVSRPLASAENTYTYTISGPNRTDRTTTRIRLQLPRFAVTGNVCYRLYRRKAPAAAGSETLVTGSTRELAPGSQYEYQDFVVYTGGKQVAYLPYYYLISAEFKPAGYGSTGASETVWSNRLGPTNTTSTPTPLPIESW